jgi:hypothetical protein
LDVDVVNLTESQVLLANSDAGRLNFYGAHAALVDAAASTLISRRCGKQRSPNDTHLPAPRLNSKHRSVLLLEP